MSLDLLHILSNAHQHLQESVTLYISLVTNVAYRICNSASELSPADSSHYEGGAKRAVCSFAINGLPAKSASSAKQFAAFVVYPHMQQQLEWMKPRDRIFFDSWQCTVSEPIQLPAFTGEQTSPSRDYNQHAVFYALAPSGASPFLTFDLPA